MHGQLFTVGDTGVVRPREKGGGRTLWFFFCITFREKRWQGGNNVVRGKARGINGALLEISPF